MNNELATESNQQHPIARVESLDILRGFAMFWIIGAEQFVHGLTNINDAWMVHFVSAQLEHAAWAGFTFYDHIFPLFLFIVGASLVFSLDKIVALHGRRCAIKRILRRFILLFLLGMIADGGVVAMGQENIFMGVLQRIAWCYLFAGIIYLTVSLRGIVIICVIVLIGYWAVLSFVPLPGAEAISFEKHKNWPNFIDSYLINGFLLSDQAYRVRHDPEGVLSTLPAIISCLSGVFAGALLKSPLLDKQKVYVCIMAGLTLLVLDYLWGIQFPIIKRIWTSSYVLVGGGWSFLLLGVTYYIVDICKHRHCLTPFVWIGMNPLVIYMAVHLIDFTGISARVFGSGDTSAFGAYGNLVNAAAAVSLAVLLCYFLYRQRIFLRA